MRSRNDRSRPQGNSVAGTFPERNKGGPEEILQKIKQLTDNGNYSVRFEMNEPTQQMVIHLLDAKSGEEIRQIPPEELLTISKRLNDLRGNIVDTTS
ncbi:MAG: flagellar protein FlaG [Syntrophotaleaceae bacterium]